MGLPILKEGTIPKALKNALKGIGAIIGIAIVVIVAYIAYLMLTYTRIPDQTPVEVENNAESVLEAGADYTVATCNIGFGAYTPEFTFFMDEGIMEDGTKTVGSHSVAANREVVVQNTEGIIGVLSALDPDFVLMQEVDTNSTRSYQVDQAEEAKQAFSSHGSAFASNFHSAYLAYPITEHHGIVNSGLLTLSGTHVDSAVRRSYPVDDSFPTKFFDLDRCFLVERIPVSNGKDLVLINSHMSAYDKGGVFRAKQMELISSVMESEAEKGNYVIAGGDWNHALCGSETLYPSKQQIAPWISIFDESLLPEGFSVVRAENIESVPTCRCADIPYEKGVTFTVTVDGFIVSDNVRATARNIDAGFAYSDHNPVKLSFELTE